MEKSETYEKKSRAKTPVLLDFIALFVREMRFALCFPYWIENVKIILKILLILYGKFASANKIFINFDRNQYK